MKKMQKEKHSTKRSLYMSAVSMLLCLVMLVGTTFAWFTHTVTNTGNRIQAGTLEVEVTGWNRTKRTDDTPNLAYYPDKDPANLGGEGFDPIGIGVIGGNEALFSNDFSYDATPGLIDEAPREANGILKGGFEPNKYGRKYIQVRNTGTLPLDAYIDLIFDTKPSTNKYGETANIAEVIKFQFDTDAVLGVGGVGNVDTVWQNVPSLDALSRDYTLATTIPGLTGSTVELLDNGKYKVSFPVVRNVEVGDSKRIAIDYLMCKFAGNAYQDQWFTADIVVTALQHNRYDEAGVPDDEVFQYVWTAQQLEDLITGVTGKAGSTIVFLADIEWPQEHMTITQPHNFDLNGHKLTIPEGYGIHINGLSPMPCAMDFNNGTIVVDNIIVRPSINAAFNFGSTLKVNSYSAVKASIISYEGIVPYISSNDDGTLPSNWPTHIHVANGVLNARANGFSWIVNGPELAAGGIFTAGGAFGSIDAGTDSITLKPNATPAEISGNGQVRGPYASISGKITEWPAGGYTTAVRVKFGSSLGQAGVEGFSVGSDIRDNQNPTGTQDRVIHVLDTGLGIFATGAKTPNSVGSNQIFRTAVNTADPADRIELTNGEYTLGITYYDAGGFIRAKSFIANATGNTIIASWDFPVMINSQPLAVADYAKSGYIWFSDLHVTNGVEVTGIQVYTN